MLVAHFTNIVGEASQVQGSSPPARNAGEGRHSPSMRHNDFGTGGSPLACKFGKDVSTASATAKGTTLAPDI